MIQESPKEVIDCVGECCINRIKGNVRLTNAQKNQLRARKQHIRLLSSKQVPLDTLGRYETLERGTNSKTKTAS